MKKTAVFLLMFLMTGSCNLSNKYPGYSKKKNGMYFQLLSFEDSERKPVPGDYITVELAYKTIDDSVFFRGKRRFQLTEPQYKGSVDECFLMLAEGESANFIISADDFFTKTLENKKPSFIPDESKMIIFMHILEVQTAKEFEKEKEAFLHWIDDFGEYERVILKQYIEDKKIDVEPMQNGMYFISVRAGNGKKIKKKDTITVHYEGKFFNGKFFDSTKKRREPFQFVYGHQMQVIKGLEDAFGMMEEGERAIVILPSELAWGRSGSSTGIIPPLTSLVFELEVLEVKKVG
jgi:FKBP-type peptidyl-prolyl cis-trans isomerase FkpA